MDALSKSNRFLSGGRVDKITVAPHFRLSQTAQSSIWYTISRACVATGSPQAEYHSKRYSRPGVGWARPHLIHVS